MFVRTITTSILLFVVLGMEQPGFADYPITDFGALAGDDKLDTQAIQSAIDQAASEGGGTVTISHGTFLSGGLILKPNVTLKLEKGAILKGSEEYRDYGEGQWQDALIKVENARNIRIWGPGEIDGSDCRNPKGEEGFRGPHGILLNGCHDIVIRDVTIRRTGNYAILCRNCEAAEIQNVTIRGGHDGLHAQACRRFTVRSCDFRTGDDCIAGCDNEEVVISDCQINSSCNGFRFGCVDLTVRGCRIWGPGEYQHQVSKRQNMLSAFVHFAPQDRNPQLPSDRWLIEDVKIDNVGFVYGYDFERGLWQTGQPAKRIRFHNVTATRVERPIRVLGDREKQFQLSMENVSLALRDDCANQPLLDLMHFGSLELREVTLRNDGTSAAIHASNGHRILLGDVTCLPDREGPYRFAQIDDVVMAGAND